MSFKTVKTFYLLFNTAHCLFDMVCANHNALTWLELKIYLFGINDSTKISNTSGRVFREISKHRSELKKRGAAGFFFTNFEEIGYLMKHSFEWLVHLLKASIIPWNIKSKSSLHFMIIRVTYPNFLHATDFLCFLFMTYQWFWEFLFQNVGSE